MSKNNGGPAFPWVTCGAEGYIGQGGANEGMTLRDYFAAKVIQGAFAEGAQRYIAEEVGADPNSLTMLRTQEDMADCVNHLLAKMAYRMADAMLAEREKPS